MQGDEGETKEEAGTKEPGALDESSTTTAEVFDQSWGDDTLNSLFAVGCLPDSHRLDSHMYSYITQWDLVLSSNCALQ